MGSFPRRQSTRSGCQADPGNNPLLTRPLVGGEGHAGGRQLSEKDELYGALLAWIQGSDEIEVEP